MKILNDNNVNFKIVEYLKEGISKKDLLDICKVLNTKPIDLIRRSDQSYKDLKLSEETINDNSRFFNSFELNPYKFNLFVMDKALATAIEVLIVENFPGP